MADATINNDIGADLDALVTWQYDNADRLTGIVDLLKDFFTKAVTVPMDGQLTLAGLKDLDEDWALNIWGVLLGLPRPQLSYGGESHQMSTENYKNLLLARYRLLCGNASVKEYVEYIKTIFLGNASFHDNMNMSASVTWNETAPETGELKALYDTYLDRIMLLPTGVYLYRDFSYHLFTISKVAMTSQDPQDERVTNMNPDPDKRGCLYWA